MNGTVGAVRIVVAGEALIDLVPDGEDALAAHLGGGPFNTARALGRLDRPVAYVGRISTDAFGQRLAGRLTADGVALDACVRTDDPTTLALVELDERGSATYRFYTDGTAAPGLTPAEALAAIPGTSIVHVGSLGLALEPVADALEALVEAVDGLVMVDPNCRPAAITDPAAYRERIRRVVARAYEVRRSLHRSDVEPPQVLTDDAERQHDGARQQAQHGHRGREPCDLDASGPVHDEHGDEGG